MRIGNRNLGTERQMRVLSEAVHWRRAVESCLPIKVARVHGTAAED